MVELFIATKRSVARSCSSVERSARALGRLLTVRDHLVALRARLHECLGLDIQASYIAIHDRLADDAPRRLGAEVVLVVEAMHQLVPALIDHGPVVDDEAILGGKVIELRARIGMRDRYLDGLYVERLGEVDGVADRLFGFARKPEDKVAVDGQPQLMAIARKRVSRSVVTRDVHDQVSLSGFSLAHNSTVRAF